ncbi:MAG TPA: glycerophosphodiester phosphodiesterase family protein [Candidatus Polarisedimenticolaceae bacterium]|nr:glycerophosphodiester phosphodiesterase family protein [Candidatus Polarisedimenticolaceae bacterium]
MSVRRVAQDAVRDAGFAWRSLFFTDLAYKLAAFAVLSPLVAITLRWLVTRRSGPVVADVDILWFFITTRSGLLVLIIGGTLLSAVTALEVSCLMAVALSAAEGKVLMPRHALAFAGKNAGNIIRLTLQMVLRVLAVAVPMGAILGGTYFTFLHGHDINFYIAKKPPSFWGAVAIVAVVVLFTLWLVLRTIARWVFAVPLVVFEKVSPRRALAESGKRSAGHRGLILGTLALWAALAIALVAAATWLPEAIGRVIAPRMHASMAGLTTLVFGLVVLWGLLSLVVGIFNVSLFSTLLVRLYRRAGGAGTFAVPEGAAWKHRGMFVAGLAGLAALVIVAMTLVVVSSSAREQAVVVIAHRGASAYAPENTLSAFRIAAEQKTDYVELDVQESTDGEVLVVHDSDLMRVGGFGTKIWDGTAKELMAIPIAWKAGSTEPPEHLPTLAEALEACKGKCKVVVELKSYGHDKQLEQKVVEIVEAAGMANDCVFMSLDHGMVHKMKEVRPAWRSGILVAQAMGDLTKLDADFYAVRAELATRRFVRRVHAENRDVYVWTVNDPAWMLAAMSRGVDGLITDRPDVAREVVGKRAAMSDAERVMVALLVRLGARPESLGPEQ